MMSSESVEKYVNEKALASTLGVTRYIIRKWRKEEGLPFITAGKKILYKLSRVTAWLEAKEQHHNIA